MAENVNSLSHFSAQSEPVIEISLLSDNIRNIINAKKQKPRKIKKIELKKGQWSYQEDRLLKQWVKLNGPKNWEACGRFIHGRKGKQCREHWSNCLNPELKKGDWTPEEDFLIMFFYEKCKGSWKKIIPLFNGRIENSIKNRFYSRLRKYATKNIEKSQKRKMKAQIKLNVLLNYLGEALNEAKHDFLKKTKMTFEQFNQFLEENEQKLKKNIVTDLEPSNIEIEANLNTSLGNASNEEDLNKCSFIQKRKRDNDFLNNDINNAFRKEKSGLLLNDEIPFESFDEKEKEINIELNEDKSDIMFKNIMSNNNGILNNNSYNMPFDIIKNGMDELLINNIESDKNNSFINIFNEKESIFGFDSCLINYQKFLAKNNLGHTIGINI
jgi:hypothetical protein